MEPSPASDLKPAKPRKPRRWWRVLGWLLLILALLLVWLNGPGVRWLAPHFANRFLERIGITAAFRLEGTLTGGLTIHDVKLSDNATLKNLTIRRASPDYRLGDLIQGRLRGIELDGINAHINLAPKPDDEPESEPPDLRALVETLRKARAEVIPPAIRITDAAVTITRDDQPFYQLESTSLTHLAKSSEFRLDLGAISGPAGHELAAQSGVLTWTAEAITLDRIEPWPGITLQELNLATPEFSGPSLSSVLRLRDAVFDLESSTDFAATSLRLREGALDLKQTAAGFGAEIPATANLTSFALEADSLFPDPLAATGELQFVLEEVAWQEWNTPEIVVGATLGSDAATLALRTRLGDAPLALDASTTLDRRDGNFAPGTVTGTFGSDNVPALIRALAEHIPAIDPTAIVPPANLAGGFEATLGNLETLEVTAATASLSIIPLDKTAATPLDLAARWTPGADVTASIAIDGLEIDASYNPDAESYAASFAAKDFSSHRIEPWLAAAKTTLPGQLRLTADWDGTGNLTENQHRGDLTLTSAEWLQPDLSPITATGSLSHDWPESVDARQLLVQAEQQSVVLNARFANSRLDLTELVWRDGGREIASGNASIPLPEDFANWRDGLADDARPLSLSIESRELPFSILDPWLPAAARLSPESTARLSIQASGSPDAPILTARLDCRNLRSPAQPNLPPADLRIDLATTNGRLEVSGSATARDFPPATLRASMPFRPATWAETPDALMQEPLDASVDLPRLELSRFATLVPALSTLSGTVSGRVGVAGTPESPEILGQLVLESAALSFKNPALPEISALSARIDASPAAITLRSLDATASGGTLNASGSLTLDGGTPTAVNFQVRGDHLPVMRDDSVIIRTNADLRLTGTWEQATLGGTIGIIDSLFYRDIELLPIGTPFNAPSAAALPRMDATPALAQSSIPPPFGDWNLDVTVRTDAPLLIRGNLAGGEVTANLRIIGTLDDPRPDGTVNINNFTARLPFSTLTVRSGTLRFTPQNRWDPAIEARGQAEPRPYRVDAYVYGRLSDPQLVLTSNPPLPENEIMTLLATGTTTSQLTNPQAASARAIQLLAEEIRRGRVRFGRQLRPLLGILDRVDFTLAESDPYDSDSFSTATIAITDRWFVSAGMGDEGNTRAFVIWRIALR